MRLHHFFIFLVSLFLFSLMARGEEKPNIILILADDLGYSDLGCYGGEIETPNLNKLAEGGLRMSQLYNTARCCSTRASLLTGLYPHAAGVGAMTADNGLPGYRGFLTDRSVTIASLLRKAGYGTYLSGKWHLRGKGNPDCIPTERGFDEFFGHFKAYASFWRKDLFVRLPEDRDKPGYGEDFYATDAITDYGLKFLDQSRADGKPAFLYLSYNAPHFPLHAPRQMIEKYVKVYEKGWDAIREERHRRMKELGLVSEAQELSPRGRVTKVPNRNLDSPWYDQQIPDWQSLSKERQADLARRMATYAAMVEILDRNVGRIVENVKKNGELEKTLIVFLSDNGACAEWDPLGFDNNPYPKNLLYKGAELEKMGQAGTFHSYGTGWANACNTPFRLYKHYNHEGGISSPAIFHWPDRITARGQLDRQPAHIVDLSATLLKEGGAHYPDEWEGKPVMPLAGISLNPVWKGEKLPERPLYFEHEGNRAIRMGKWKLVWTNFREQWELYDIEKDRTELHDLAKEYPDRVAKMEIFWEKWAESNYVEKSKVKQPAAGMPKIYYFSK